ncbi:amino acid ABC transporter permease [Methylobrevis pamukkalensis]|uniref:Glutamate/aspartate import permease protein GltK n=1 Tax=Methylobrevis pamukkalensis TaxID=1439726 RepID=A0A1E3H3Z0_9HYPH|nr:amino acid ABC transporter permease [Methylobrevis pamukkalensis]ODN71067.1 Inner membrane amino-acid ABC transporter permease protein YecS [Methylobrevis pamukkalensis]
MDANSPARAGRDPEETGDDLVVVTPKHPLRWVMVALVMVIAGFALSSVATNPNFQWPVVGRYLFDPIVLSGFLTTLWLTVVTMIIGVVLGIVLAVMRLSSSPIISGAAGAYLWFFRGTPMLVQLIFWYNLAALYPRYWLGLPLVDLTLFEGSFNDLITPYTAAILGLGLNEGAYMAEIVRAGIDSVDGGQKDAARALGMPRRQAMRRVILPQAMRFIVPPTGNQTIGMLKGTSIVSIVALSDLLYSVQTIYSRTFQTIPLLLVACFWYLVATTLLSIVQARIERHFARGDAGRGPARDEPPAVIRAETRPGG